MNYFGLLTNEFAHAALFFHLLAILFAYVGVIHWLWEPALESLYGVAGDRNIFHIHYIKNKLFVSSYLLGKHSLLNNICDQTWDMVT